MRDVYMRGFGLAVVEIKFKINSLGSRNEKLQSIQSQQRFKNSSVKSRFLEFSKALICHCFKITYSHIEH